MTRVLLVLLGAAAVAAPAAHAAYPGANGRLVFFQEDIGGDEPVGLAVSDADGRNQTIGPFGPRCGFEPASQPRKPCPRDPQWSPDGTRIAFGLGDSIALINADGSGLRQLSFGLTAVTSPTWSPDGRRLAFSARSPALNGRRLILVVNTDGTNIRSITYVGSSDLPAWSSRGEIAFVRSDNIEVINPDATGFPRARRITSRGGTRPTWSPSGYSIAFTRKVRLKRKSKRRTPVLYRVSASGRRLRRLTRGRAEDPSWTPDGQAILFERFDGVANSIIRSVDPLGRKSRTVTGGFEGRRSAVSSVDQQPLPR